MHRFLLLHQASIEPVLEMTLRLQLPKNGLTGKYGPPQSCKRKTRMTVGLH